MNLCYAFALLPAFFAQASALQTTQLGEVPSESGASNNLFGEQAQEPHDLQEHPGLERSNRSPAHPDKVPDNGLLAAFSLSDTTSLSFEFANGVIVMNAKAKEGDYELEEILNNENKEGGVAANPVLLFKKLSGKTSPPGLTKAWEAILKARSNGEGNDSSPPQEITPPTTLEDEVEANDEGRSLRARVLLTGDWWRDKYCSKFAMVHDSCRCYKRITNNYGYWLQGDRANSYVYPYRGSLRLTIKEWRNGSSQLATTWVPQGYVGWAKAWGPYQWYGAFVTSAYNDHYHFSMYTFEDEQCKANAWFCKDLCLNDNF